MSHSPPRDADSFHPRPTLSTGSSHDAIKIMLATDNHIGYLERDPVRGQDAVNTFEEILQLSVKHDVDFILLGGDLFHDNRPSRESIYRVIALLREYTLGDKPVEIELLSDPCDGKAPGFSFPGVNYEDPNLNVSIPVFSIHGNHDDPQGAGPEGALCVLDMLSASGLINYMGKTDLSTEDSEAQSTGLAVKPVLLRKGRTRLGLYGIGNIKDARMHYELRSNRVRMFMPRDKEDWFNILLIHQNRVKHGPQQYVPEGMFDDSINLVLWGHEHDCRIDPESVAGKEYYITQPGSSVATSLADGEALQKHVAILEICGTQFQLNPIPLRTVRPFVMEDIVLTDLDGDEKIDVTKPMEVAKYLKSRVNALINTANTQWDERNAAAVAAGEKELPRMLPLIRLKVDTTGVPEMSNPVRFGQEFTGKIANPRDVLFFHRAKRSAARGGKVTMDEPELSIDDPDMPIHEKLERVRVATLVKEYLGAQELQLLGESGMSDAIQAYVDKDDIHSISRFVTRSLSSLQKGIKSQEVDEEDLEDMLTKAKAQEEEQYVKQRAAGKVTKGKQKQSVSDRESVDSMTMDVDAEGSDFEEAPRTKATTKASATKKTAASAKSSAKAPPKGRGKGKAKVLNSEDEEEQDFINDDDDEGEEEAPKPKKSSRAAILGSSSAKKTPAKKSAAAKETTSKAASTKRATSGRATAGKARGKIAEVLEISSDE